MPKSKSVKEIMPVEVFDKISRVITPGNVSPTLFLCRTYLEQLEWAFSPCISLANKCSFAIFINHENFVTFPKGYNLISK